MFPYKRQVALGLTFLFIVMGIGSALAEEAQEKLSEVRQQMEVQQSRRQQAQQQVDTLSNQLQTIQKDLDKALNEYKEIVDKRKITEQQIEANTEILEKTEAALAERSRILNKRMRDIYKNGQISYLDVLLGANDFSDFATRVEILKRVIRQDINLITTVQAERNLILEKREQLVRDKAAVVELEKAAEDKQQVIAQRKKERATLLASAVQERDESEREYQNLLEESRRIEEMLRRRGSTTTESAGSTGSMLWPIQGEITSPYGWRTHPIFGTQRYHSGIDIAGDYGDPIKAADGGIVSDASWWSGYGNMVVIDHGGNIQTLYGHCSQLLVSEGQHVSKGQVIALVGATGYATGPHLHFEVRQNGSPVDPMGYLP